KSGGREGSRTKVHVCLLQLGGSVRVWSGLWLRIAAFIFGAYAGSTRWRGLLIHPRQREGLRVLEILYK
ncbi:unnamed protein product, partial [Ascophyllum nodosum]